MANTTASGIPDVAKDKEQPIATPKVVSYGELQQKIKEGIQEGTIQKPTGGSAESEKRYEESAKWIAENTEPSEENAFVRQYVDDLSAKSSTPDIKQGKDQSADTPTSDEEAAKSELKRQNKTFELDKHSWADTEGTTGSKRNETDKDDGTYHWNGHTDENGNFVSGLAEWAEDNQARINSELNAYNDTIENSKFLTEEEVQAHQQELANLYYDCGELEEYSQKVIDDFKAEYDQHYFSSEEEKASWDAELARLEGNQKVYGSWKEDAKELYDKWSGANEIYSYHDDDKLLNVDDFISDPKYFAAKEYGGDTVENLEKKLARLDKAIEIEEGKDRWGTNSTLTTYKDEYERTKDAIELAKEREDSLRQQVEEVNDDILIGRKYIFYSPEKFTEEEARLSLLQGNTSLGEAEKAQVDKELAYVQKHIESNQKRAIKDEWSGKTDAEIKAEIDRLTKGPEASTKPTVQPSGRSAEEIQADIDKLEQQFGSLNPIKDAEAWDRIQEQIDTLTAEKATVVPTKEPVVEDVPEYKRTAEEELKLQALESILEDRALDSLDNQKSEIANIYDQYMEQYGENGAQVWMEESSAKTREATAAYNAFIEENVTPWKEAEAAYLMGEFYAYPKGGKYDEVRKELKEAGIGENDTSKALDYIRNKMVDLSTNSKEAQEYYKAVVTSETAAQIWDSSLKDRSDYNTKVAEGQKKLDAIGGIEGLRKLYKGGVDKLASGLNISTEDAKALHKMLGTLGVDEGMFTPSTMELDSNNSWKNTLRNFVTSNIAGEDRPDVFSQDEYNNFLYLFSDDVVHSAEYALEKNSAKNAAYEARLKEKAMNVTAYDKEKHPGSFGFFAVVDPVATAIMNMTGIVDYVKTGSQIKNLGHEVATGMPSLAEWASVINEVNTSIIGQGDYGFVKPDVVEFLYNAYSSMIQSRVNAAAVTKMAGGLGLVRNASPVFLGKNAFELASGAFSDVSFFGSASMETYRELRERGIDPARAWNVGTAAGVFEAAFEHISLDKIIHEKDVFHMKNFGEALGEVMVHNAIEGVEEICTETANKIYERMALGEDSTFWRNVTNLRKEGLTKAEAIKKEYLNEAKEILLAGAAGFVSSFAPVSASTFSAYARSRNEIKGAVKILGSEINKSASNVEGETLAQRLGTYLGNYEFYSAEGITPNKAQQKEVNTLKDLAAKAAEGKASDTELAQMIVLANRYDSKLYDDFVMDNMDAFMAISPGSVGKAVINTLSAMYGEEDAQNFLNAFYSNPNAYVEDEFKQGLRAALGDSYTTEYAEQVEALLGYIVTGNSTYDEETLRKTIQTIVKDDKTKSYILKFLGNQITKYNQGNKRVFEFQKENDPSATAWFAAVTDRSAITGDFENSLVNVWSGVKEAVSYAAIHKQARESSKETLANFLKSLGAVSKTQMAKYRDDGDFFVAKGPDGKDHIFTREFFIQQHKKGVDPLTGKPSAFRDLVDTDEKLNAEFDGQLRATLGAGGLADMARYNLRTGEEKSAEQTQKLKDQLQDILSVPDANIAVLRNEIKEIDRQLSDLYTQSEMAKASNEPLPDQHGDAIKNLEERKARAEADLKIIQERAKVRSNGRIQTHDSGTSGRNGSADERRNAGGIPYSGTGSDSGGSGVQADGGRGSESGSGETLREQEVILKDGDDAVATMDNGTVIYDSDDPNANTDNLTSEEKDVLQRAKKAGVDRLIFVDADQLWGDGNRAAGYYVIIGGKKTIVVNSNRGTVNGYHEAMHYCLDSYTKEEKRSILDEFVVGVFKNGNEFTSFFNLYNNEVHQKVYASLYKAFKNGNTAPYYYALYEEMLCDLWHGLNRYHIPNDQFKSLQQRAYAFVVQKQIVEHAADKAKQNNGEKQETKESKNPLIKFLTGERKPNDVLESLHGNLAYKVRFLGDEREGDHSTARYSLFVKDADDKYHKVGEFYADEIGTELSKQEAEFRHKYGLGIAVPGDTWAGVLKRIEDIRGSKKAPETYGGIPRAETPETQEAPKVQETPKAERTVEEQKAEEFFDFLVRQSDDFDLDPFITAASDARLQYISGLEGASDAEKQVIAAVKREVERRQTEDRKTEEASKPQSLDTSIGEARLAQVRENVHNLSEAELAGMMRQMADILGKLSKDNPDRIILEPVANILINEYRNRLTERGSESSEEEGTVISNQPATDLPLDNPTGKAGEAKVDPEYQGDTEETEESDTEEDTGNSLKEELASIEKEIQEIEDNIKDIRKDRDQQIKNEPDKDMRDLIKGQANDAIKYWKDQVNDLKKRATAIRSQLLKENKKNKRNNRGSVRDANIAKGSKKKPNPSAATHIDNRSLDDVGKTNVNAFQYDNPEIKPFFKRAAEILMHDLIYLQSTRRNEYGKGTFFEVDTDFLEAVRKNFKSIDDAVAACEAVIYDKGGENYVGPKRIEIFLDQMLTNGYTPINLDSETIEPSREYMDLKGALEGGTPFDARQKAIDDLRIAYLEDGLTDEELGKIVDENKARTGYYDPDTRDGQIEVGETTTEVEPETTEQPEQTGRTVSEIDAEMEDVSAEIESLLGQIENAPGNVSEDKYAELNERLREREAYYDTLQAEWKDAYATGRFSVDESYSPTIPDLYGKFSVESLANGTGFETLYQSVKTGKLTTLEDWIRDVQSQPREPGQEMPTRDSLQEEFSRKVKYGEVRVYGVARRNPDGTLTEMHVETITSEDMKNSPLGFLIACAEENGRISKEEAERQYDFLRDLTRMLFHYHDEGLIWEVVGSEMFAAIKSNSDPQYNRTIDFSTICKKTQAVIDAVGMTMQLLDTGLSKDEIKLVYKLVGEAGESTPCPVCYVFSRWMGLGSVLDNIKRYQQLYGETTPSGKEKVLELVKEVQRAAEAKMEGTDLTFGKAVNAAQKDVELRLKVAESAFNDYEKALKNPNAKKYKGRNITTDENGNPRSQDYWAEQISSLAKEYDKFDAYKWAVKTRLINADLLVKNSEAVAAKLVRMGIEGKTLNEILENAKNSNNDDEDFVALWDELQSNLTDLEIVDEDRLKELHRKQELRKQQSSLKAAVTREFGKDFTNGLKKLSAIEQALKEHPDSVALKNLYENRKEFDAIGEEYVFRKGYRDVPDKILFDLNQGEKFARYYPATWSYRTTRGSGLGKAIMPYSDARVGEIIQGMAVSDVKNIQIGKDKNAFLNLVLPEKREEAKKILAAARKKMAAQNLIGGMRFQSTSDFRYEYASDYLMAFFEMQAMGANVQLYTKVLEAVDFFANVGCDVNLSVMPRDKGIGVLNEKPRDWDTNYDRYFTRKNNKYVRLKKGDVAPKFVPGKYHAILYSDVTGVNGGAAREYVQKYDNVQMIMVGISADHINACLDSDDITFVIPFHGSGNSTKDIQQLMQLLGETIDAKNITDFTPYQTDAEKEKNSPARNLRKKIVSGGCLINGRITLTTEEANILEGNVFLKDLFRRFYLDATDRNGRVDRAESEKNRQNVTILTVHEDGTTSVNKDFNIDFGKVNDRAFAKKYYLDGKNECYGNFLSGITANQIFPYEYWDKSLKQSEAKGNGDAFQEYCKSLGLIPRFSGWAKGKYSAKNDFTKNDNYWKLLIDRKMYDNQGNYRAQRQIDLSNIDAFRYSDESYEGDRRIAVTDLNPNYGQVTFGNNSPFANRVNPKVNGRKDNSVISKINDPRKTNAIATIAAKIINEARDKSDSRAKRRLFADSEDIRQAIDAGDYITAANMLIEDPGTRFYEENGTLYLETDEGVMRVEKNGDLVPVENTTRKYSVDSDGNELSPGQIEYFANSKARDENGNLIVFYHGTKYHFGFTEVDFSSMNDKISFFLTSSPDIGSSYASTSKVRSLFDDFKSAFSKSIDEMTDDELANAYTRASIPYNEYAMTAVFGDNLNKFRKAYEDNITAVLDFIDNELPKSFEGNDEKTKQLEGIRKDAESLRNYESPKTEEEAFDQKDSLLSIWYDFYSLLDSSYDKNRIWDDIDIAKRNIEKLAEYLRFQDRSGIQDSDTVFIGNDGDLYTRSRFELLSNSRITEAQRKEAGGIYKGYANLVNPYIIDAHGNEWYEIDAPHEVIDYLKSLGEPEHYFFNEHAQEGQTNTRGIARYAKDHGYDGIMIRNCVDVGFAGVDNWKKPESTIAVVFNSNQFKDAKNLNPTENPDMRFSVDEQDVEAFNGWLNWDTPSDGTINYHDFENMFRNHPETDFYSKMIQAAWAGGSTKAVEKEFQEFVSSLDEFARVKLRKNLSSFFVGSNAPYYLLANTPSKTADKLQDRLTDILDESISPKKEFKPLTEEQLNAYRPDFIAAIQQMQDRDSNGNYIGDSAFHKSHQALYDLFQRYPELDYMKRLAYAKNGAEKDSIRAEFSKLLSGIDDRYALWQLSAYSIYPSRGIYNGGSGVSGEYDRLNRVNRIFSNTIEKRRNQILEETGFSTNVKLKAREYTLQEIRDMFDQLNHDEQLVPLAEKVFGLAGDLGLTIRGAKGTAFRDSYVGGQQLGSIVEYNINRFNDLRLSDQAKAGTLLHELIHSCTQYAIKCYDGVYQNLHITNEMMDAVRQIKRVYEAIKDDPSFVNKNGKRLYGTKSASEMIAELSNPEFREALEKKNLFQRIVDAIKKLFGIDTKNALDAASVALDYLLDNFNYDAYLDWAEYANKVKDNYTEITQKAKDAIHSRHPGEVRLSDGYWVNQEYAEQDEDGEWNFKSGYYHDIDGNVFEVDPITGESFPAGSRDNNSPQDGFMSGAIDDNSNYSIEGFFDSFGNEVTVGKFSADDEQMASTLQMYEDLVDPSEWKASEHQNMNERMYNRISNGISLWDKVVSFYDTVDEDNYNWLSYEDITQAMRINPYNGNVDGEDMPLASEVMWSLLHLARDQGSDVKERIYRLMEEIAPHLMRTEQDKWIRPVSSRFPPIDFDFSNWYNERNPMPEVGYTPKPLEQLHQEAIEATNEANFQRRAYRRSLATGDEYNRAAEKARRAWNMYSTRFNAEQGKGKFSVDIDPDAAFDSFGYEVELDDYSPVVTQSDLSENLYYSEDGNTAYYMTDTGETVVLNNVGTDSPEARYIEYLEAMQNANDTNTTATKPYIIPPANRNGNDGYNLYQPNAGLRYGAEEVLEENQKGTLRPAGSNGELYAEGVPQSEETQGVRYSAEEETPGARYSTMYDADSDTFVNENGEVVATDDMYPIGSFTREIFKAMKSGDQSLKNVEDLINKLLDRKFNIYEEDYNTVRQMIQINDAYTPEQRKAMLDAMEKLVKKHGRMRSAKEDMNQDLHFAVQRDQGDTIDDPNHKGKKITRKEFVKRATEGKDPFTGKDSDKTMTEKEANELFDKQGTVIMKFTQTVARNTDKEWLTDEAVRMALTDESMSYTPVSNDQAIRRAQQRFDRAGTYEKALAEWDGIVHSERTPKQVDVAFGELLLKSAAEQGRINDTVKLVSDLTLMAHTTGQTLQAFRILKKMTPRGQLYYIQSVVDDLNKRYDSRIKNGKMGRVTLNQDLVELLLSSSTREELDTAVDLIKRDLAEQIPATWMDQWNAWRYLAMLGNPRTHFRNIFGNGAFMPAVFIKDMISRRLETKYVDPKLRMRIAGADLSKNSAYRQRAEQDFKVMAKIIAGEAGGNKYSDIQDILGQRDVFPFKWLNDLARFNGGRLTAEDMWFMHKYYTRAFAEALQARGIKEEDVQNFDTNPDGRKILNEVRNWAMEEAQRNTYHDANKLASLLNQMKRSSPAAYVVLEGLVPFTKTPANILKRGIEYSPIGLISSYIQLGRDLRSGEYSTSQCIDRLAAGWTGTGFLILGFILSKLGILRGGGPDDKKEEAFESLQGHQPWSIEIGGLSYTLDWMAPLALPLFVGATIYSMLKGDHVDITDADTWMALTRIADPLLSLSMLDGIENTLSAVSNANNTSKLGVLGISMLGSYIAQGMPTIFGQAARILDTNRRKTFVPEDAKSSALKQWVQSSIQAKIPDPLRLFGGNIPGTEDDKKLYVDMWGRTEGADTFGEVLWKIAENVISPGYHKWINETPVDAELQRLYEATEDKSVLPGYVDKSIGPQSQGKDDEGNEIIIDGKKLTADEMTKYEMTVGQNRYQLLNDIFASPEYQAATETEKKKIVNDAYAYAKSLGEKAVIAGRDHDSEWMNLADKIGASDYILIRQEYESNKSNEKIFSWLVNNPNLNESQVATLIADKFNPPDNVESISTSGFLYDLKGSDEDAIKEINAQIIKDGLRELYRSEEYQNAPDKDVMLRQFYEESKTETIRLYGEMLDQTDRVKYVGKAATIGAESFSKVLDLTMADVKGDYRNNIEAQSSWLGYKYKADTSINNPLHEGYSIELDKTQRSRLESRFRDRWNEAYDELLHSEKFQNAPSREYQEDMIARRFNQVSTEVENEYAAELYQAGGYSETFGRPGSFTWSKAYEIADRELSTPKEQAEWLAGKYSPGSSIDDPDQAAYEIALTTEDKNQLKKEFASAYVPRYVKMVNSAEFKALDPTTQEYKKEELRKDVAKSVQEAYARKLKADGYASVAFDDKANLANKYEYLASNDLSDKEKIEIIKDSYVGGTIANAEARGYRKKMFDEWMDNPANTKSYLEQNTADGYEKMRKAADKYAGDLTKKKYGGVKNYNQIEDFDLYDVYYTTNNPIDSTPPVKIDAPATSKTDKGALLRPGNIDLDARPIVRNSDGSYSTVDTVTWEVDGQYINVPTVIYVDGETINGEYVEGWVHVDDDTALEHYYETGEHLGIYSDKDSAVKAAEQLHKDQAKQYDSQANFWAGLIRH